jgi:hypothetical protein
MTTRKTTTPRAAHPPATSHRRLNLGSRSTQAAVAGAAVLGAGVLTTGAIMMRGTLGRLARSAAVEATSLGKQLDASHLLAFAGLQRKESMFSRLAPGLGTLIIGLAAGSAVTFLLVRSTRRPQVPADSPRAEQPKSTHDGLGSPSHAEVNGSR